MPPTPASGCATRRSPRPALLGDDPKPRITLALDADKRQLTVEDNGIGMSREEMVEALGTIARSGTKAFLDRIEAAQSGRGNGADRPVRRRLLFGLHGRRPRRRDFAPRRHRRGLDVVLGRQGLPSRVSPADAAEAPRRGTRVVLHLMEDAKSYTERFDRRAAGQGAVRSRAGADRHRRKAGRRARRSHRRRRACGRSRNPRSRRPITPTSIAALPDSSTSRR